MKKTSKFSRFFKFFWFSASDPNPYWDAFINRLMDVGEVTHIDTYVIQFNGKYDVWISNHPYTSGCLYNFNARGGEAHCTKKTKIRLEDYVNAYIELNDHDNILLKEGLESLN